MNPKVPLVVTIGVFDGVHRGHQALARASVALAKKLRAKAWAVTFSDHPLHILKGGAKIPFLVSRKETFRLLTGEGLSRVSLLPFTKGFSKKSPEEFVLWLKRLGNLKGVVVGENFRFGRGAEGDTRELKSLGKKYGFEVRTVAPVRVGGKVVSSSLIRKLLVEGKLESVRAMLGRSYSIEGRVAHGKHLGHKIGFPTANLQGVSQFLPRDGVYACAVEVGDKIYRAGMNLGKRPTFQEDDHHRAAEAHLLNYYGRLYGRWMRVYLLKYLRPEKKFADSKALVGQIRKDLVQVRRVSLRGLK